MCGRTEVRERPLHVAVQDRSWVRVADWRAILGEKVLHFFHYLPARARKTSVIVLLLVGRLSAWLRFADFRAADFYQFRANGQAATEAA